MLSIFKTKPKLAELIPTNYVDIHSHLLPGIDDGAKNTDDSKILLQTMIEYGFSKVITTPHTMANVWDNTNESIANSFATLNKETQDLVQQVNLKFASEYFVDESLIENLNKTPLLTLKENYVLIEFSFLAAPLQLYDYLFELQLKGYQLVLAHPERYSYLHFNKKEYEKLKKVGCKFQLNLLATTGYYGKEVADMAAYLLKKNLYDFVGSDIHHKNHLNAFQDKLVIKNYAELEAVIANNQFFN